MNSKTRLWISAAIIALAVGYLVILGVSNGSMYYLTVDELLEKKASLMGQTVRVQGVVAGGSINWEPGPIRLSFEIQSDSGVSLPVVFNDIRPDNFESGREVVLEGRLREDGLFAADNILVKCPSKYEAETAEPAQRDAGERT